MIFVALASIVALAATAAGCFRALRAERRESRRREDLLVNQILNLSGKPWEPAPADEAKAPPEPPHEPGLVRYTQNPEAFPAEWVAS